MNNTMVWLANNNDFRQLIGETYIDYKIDTNRYWIIPVKLFIATSLFSPSMRSNSIYCGRYDHPCAAYSNIIYTAHKMFTNSFGSRTYDPHGAIISKGRCQKTLVYKSAK